TRRAWDAERWRTLFLEHPLLRSLATGLVWSAQAGAGLPALLFRLREDGTLVDATDQPLALPARGQVLLAHPLELPPDALAAWREHFADRDLAQPFVQLDRTALQLAETECGAHWWTLYEGYVVKASELRRAAQHAGWEVDDPKDGGHSVMWKLFPAAGVEAVLETEFVWSGAERYVSTPLIRLGFLPLGAVRHGPELDGDNSDGVPSLARGSQSQLLALGEVPPIAFSEAAADVAAFARLGAYDPAWRAHTAV
ncbi:MAG TPA: DUF4132 domain-containing protein, partial [Ktedonobacterales bacterium]|nr:DUF4132 domain-containing protein [Ktedonobacterales bacterium]